MVLCTDSHSDAHDQQGASNNKNNNNNEIPKVGGQYYAHLACVQWPNAQFTTCEEHTQT